MQYIGSICALRIMPLLPAQEWQNFETVYLKDMKADNFTGTKSWLKSNSNTSISASILSYDWDASSNRYSVGQSVQILYQILCLWSALIRSDQNLAKVYIRCPTLILYETIEDCLIFNPAKRGEIWRYFTHSFVHASGGHLWINILLLLLSGIPLELIHDGANVSLIFMAGTVAGAFLCYAADTTLLVGASAGVYALLFTHIGNTVVNGDLMSPKSLLITLILNLPLFALFLYDVISIGVGKESSTSFSAHLGGLITGLTFGTCIIRNFNEQTWENNVKYVCWLVFVLLGGALFFCQFATFDHDYINLVEGSDISMPKLSAGGWGGMHRGNRWSRREYFRTMIIISEKLCMAFLSI